MTAFIIIDVETSGLDPEEHELLEVGAAVFDAEHGAITECRSSLVQAESNPAEHINRIPASLVSSEDIGERGWAASWLMDMVEGARRDWGQVYLLAHRAEFDRAWLPELDDERWICTKFEADWPLCHREAPSLVELALSYDVGVVRAHRAIEDCLTLAAVLSRVHQIEGGLDGWLARALEPRREVRALVSYDDRQLAKDAGFRWDPDRKLWVKQVRESKLEALAAEVPFEVRQTEAT